LTRDIGQADGLVNQGVILRSDTGANWDRATDPVAMEWGPHKIAATDRGFVAAGGKFGASNQDGSTEWSAALLFSADGNVWSLASQVAPADILSIASSRSTVTAFTDGHVILVSENGGKTFDAVDTAAAGFDTGLPRAVTVLDNGTWVAVGKAGHAAAAWKSADGKTWKRAAMEEPGVPDAARSMNPYAVASGPMGAVAVASADTPACEIDDDDPTCNRSAAAWLTTDGSTWRRLGESSPITNAWGRRIWSAGAWGVVTNDAGRQRSVTGEAWTPVAGTDGIGVDVFVRSEREIVVGGFDLRQGLDAPSSATWVGSEGVP
jgi:hypothetical protein